MASLTLRGLNDRFPEGTSLGAYPLSNWTPGQQPVAGTAPAGSATATASVSGDAVTLAGLADDTAYVVTDSGGTKYVHTDTKVSHGSVEVVGHKNAVGGYAGLDANAKVPWALLQAAPIHPMDSPYNAKFDLQEYADGAMTGTGANPSRFFSNAATFTPADVGKPFLAMNVLSGAQPALFTTIAAYVDAHHVDLAAPATIDNTNVKFQYGSDDTAAIQAAIDAGGLRAGSIIATSQYADKGVAVVTGPPGRSAFITAPLNFAHSLVTFDCAARIVRAFNGSAMVRVNANAVELKCVLDGNANRADIPSFVGDGVALETVYDEAHVHNCRIWNIAADGSSAVAVKGDDMGGASSSATTPKKYSIRENSMHIAGSTQGRAQALVKFPGCFGQTPAPAAAPTAVATLAAGSLGSGTYRYAVTFVNANGETTIGPEATVVTDGTHQQVALSNIPTGGAAVDGRAVTARNIYRTVVGGVAGAEKLLATIADNVTTTFTDNVSDATLSANKNIPGANSSGRAENSGTSFLIDNKGNGCDLADFSGVVSCHAHGNNLFSYYWNTNSSGVRIMDNRIAGALEVLGSEHLIGLNLCGGPSYKLGTDARGCQVALNKTSAVAWQDLSGRVDNNLRDNTVVAWNAGGLRIGLTIAATTGIDPQSRFEAKSKGASTDVLKLYNSANGNLLAKIKEGSSNQGAFSLADSAGTISADLTAGTGLRLGSALDITMASAGTATGVLKSSSTERFRWGSTGISFFAAAEVAKQTVTGAKGGNAALASLLTALANYGLITDSSSA